jgi:hypothetical protein
LATAQVTVKPQVLATAQVTVKPQAMVARPQVAASPQVRPPMPVAAPQPVVRPAPPPLPAPVIAKAPPPLPVVDLFAPVATPTPEPARVLQRASREPARVDPVRYDSLPRREAEVDISMFDGDARRRRVGWTLGLLTLFVLAAVTLATILSHFRPT